MAGHAGHRTPEETGMTIKIAGITGSLRRASVNRMLLQAAAQALPVYADFAVWESMDRIPPFNEDWEADPAPVAVAELRQVIAHADALLIATPEYNGSFPGQLKNALDWASRPYGRSVLQGKPTAVISASPSPAGAAQAAADLRRVLSRARAAVLDVELAVPGAHAKFGPDGQLTDPELDRRLRTVAGELAQAGADRREAA
jgi:chromate reductase, NAD(P)H dehydrogenase (quinone)